MLAENHGKKAAQKAVWLGFMATAVMTVYMQVSLLFTPGQWDSSQVHLQSIFGFLPRIVIASLIAYIVSQSHDVWMFHLIRKKTQGRMLWLRNNASTFLSNIIDSTLFCLLAFAPIPWLPGGEQWAVVISIWVTTIVLKMIIAVIDTPFIYLGRSIGLKLKAQEASGAV
jgi:uncharacterized integral membrane protein (TIGR00697 family)